MGFFSDLKDDLSQAVNELMPEEELEAALAAQAGTEIPSTENVIQEETPMAEDTLESVDLDSMLDKLAKEAPAEEATMPELAAEQADEAVLEELPLAEPEAESMVEEAPLAEAVPNPVMEEVPETEPVSEPEAVMEEITVEEPVEEAAVMPEPAAEPEEDKQTIQNGGGEKKKMEVQTNRVAVDETAVVTEGMTITGDIVSEGSMELIGTVNGNLDILGKLNITGTVQGNSRAAEIYAEGAKITGEVNSQGSVKIGQSSVVIGNIAATSAVVAGAVKGDIDVQGPVILDTTAIVMGNIKSKSVQINNGAVIEGMCSQCYADVNPTSFFEEFKKKK